MSAVSSESHEPAGEPGRAAAPEPAAGQADFGANEWLVEELYQRYLADPGSVDRAWWSFFADYQPSLPNGTGPQPVINLQAAPAPAQATAPPRQAAPVAAPGARAGFPGSPGSAGPGRPPRPRRHLPLPLHRRRRRAPRSAGCAARRPAPSAT